MFNMFNIIKKLKCFVPSCWDLRKQIRNYVLMFNQVIMQFQQAYNEIKTFDIKDLKVSWLNWKDIGFGVCSLI